MKSLIFATLIVLSSSAFAVETLSGKFLLDDTQYELTYSYNVPANQPATSQKVQIIDDTRLPDQTETLPAYCMFSMSFPVNYSVVIKNISTQEIVYSRYDTAPMLASVYGGSVAANECDWKVSSWSEKVSTMLRATEGFFQLKGKPYRYIMDTYSSIEAAGNSDGVVVAKTATPMKATDGRSDGQVWLDTQPDASGNYNRIWFPLSF